MKPVFIILILNLIILIVFGLSKIRKPDAIQPWFVVFYLSVVFAILLLIAAIFPANGIKLGKNVKIQFTTLNEIFSSSDKAESEDFKKVKKMQGLSAEEIAAQMMNTAAARDTIKDEAPPINKRMSFLQLQFPDNNRSILNTLFKALEGASSASQPVRILHYGDSQIENDRITSYIRNELQKKFGGCGPGMIPATPIYQFEPFAYQTEFSEGWYNYAQFWNRNSTVSHNRYGAMADFSQFTPAANDSVIQADETEAWVSFSASNLTFSKTRKFQQCRVFYGYNPAPFYWEISTGDVILDADIVPASNQVNTIQCSFENTVSEVLLKFKGSASPQIFGVALDGRNGVAVDNIAMRGNAGLLFTRLDEESLKQHFQALNVKMIILQFGGNIVPDVSDNYINIYEKAFYRQIMRIKEILPDVAIVVIGVADMSVKVKTHFESYPKIDKVRDAMKRATFKAGAAYWDMYQAMGGKNSMPGWVNEKLATSDYVHLTPKGARLIANMFTGALIHEYNYYKNQQVPATDSIATETQAP